jgi:MATE family multidrug resistance protein
MLNFLKTNWSKDGGYKDILGLAIPLIIGTSYLAILEFTDRMFLAWYSKEALAAVTPAGVLNFSLTSFFIGISVYIGNFVAQYFGAKQYKRIGAFFFHGLYITFFGAFVMFVIAFFSEKIFDFIGHDPSIRKYEIVYFRIVCFGVFAPIFNAFMMSFVSSIGKNIIILVVNLVSIIANIFLDYAFIFGKYGFEEMGVFGSALATVIAGFLGTAIYAVYLCTSSIRKDYSLFKNIKFEMKLMIHILKYSFPNGVQFILDVAGFTIFLLIIGRLGIIELASSNIALNINNIAFMPMFGLGMAISILVGQSIGNNKKHLVAELVKSGLQIGFLYMGIISICYIVIPYVFIFPFSSNANSSEFTKIFENAKVILRFVALYSIFDTMNIVFTNSIKGAGDTKFVMVISILGTLLLLLLPTFILVEIFKADLFFAWLLFTITVISMSFIYLARYKSGIWKRMTLIEPEII